MKINTTQSVADALNISTERVRQSMKALGIKFVDCPCCGAKERGITDADVKRIASRNTKVGAPKKAKKGAASK